MANGYNPLRNPAARNPLMRKGGPHQEAKQSVRPRLDKRQLLNEFDDWQDELLELTTTETKEGPDGPSFLSLASTCHLIQCLPQ